jgi:hypothetical protein
MAIQVAHMGTSKVIRLKGAPAKAVVAPSSWSHAQRSASGRHRRPWRRREDANHSGEESTYSSAVAPAVAGSQVRGVCVNKPLHSQPLPRRTNRVKPLHSQPFPRWTNRKRGSRTASPSLLVPVRCTKTPGEPGHTGQTHTRPVTPV